MSPKKIDPRKVVSGIFTDAKEEASDDGGKRMSSLLGDSGQNPGFFRNRGSKESAAKKRQNPIEKGLPQFFNGLWQNEFGAIDLGNDSIKFILLSFDGRKIRVKDVQIEKILPISGHEDIQAEREKEIMDGLLRIAARTRPKTCVSISLNDPSLYIDSINVPTVSEKECRELVQKTLAEKRLIDMDASFFDYSEVDGEGLADTRNLLVIAAPKDLVYREYEMVRNAGFRVFGVETNVLATLQALSQVTKWAQGEQILILDIGYRFTDLSIVLGERITFSRTIPIAGERFTRAIQERLGCAFDDAEILKVKYGLSELPRKTSLSEESQEIKSSEAETADSADKTQGPFEALEPDPQKNLSEAEQVSVAVVTEVEKLLAEIERSFQFAVTRESRSQGIQIDNIFLMGGGARLLRLKDALRARWGIPVREVNFWDGFAINEKRLDREFLSEVNDLVPVSLGLALRIKEWKVLPFGWGMPG